MSRAMQPARTMTQTLDDIISDFELIDDWDERYRYLIELGRTLEPLPESARTEANRVKGCASQVWLETARGSDGALLFRGDSDAHIVKGLVRLAVAVYSGRQPEVVAATDIGPVFERLGLSQHLTPQRSNGVRAMMERIRSDARAVLAG
jgi:cysteine desulfuration protein SufE